MRLASIDIGTNTILMLIADIKYDGSLTVIKDEHIIARLGKGVDEHGIIQQETFGRVLRSLSDLITIADSYKIDHLIACGTSALRDATNRQKFINFIKMQLDIDIQVITGQEEAELTYIGATSDYLNRISSNNFAVLDIGGGGPELILGYNSTITSAISIDIGSVRLTERILKTNPPDEVALVDSLQFIQDHLKNVFPLPSDTKLIGVAGTLTTLAALDLKLPSFDKNKINGHILSLEAVNRIFLELRVLTLNEILKYPQILPSRADIILAGIIILKEVLSKIGLRQITVSDKGLRYGLLLKTARRLFNSCD